MITIPEPPARFAVALLPWPPAPPPVFGSPAVGTLPGLLPPPPQPPPPSDGVVSPPPWPFVQP